jgi:galactose mutarotase-like enzyme
MHIVLRSDDLEVAVDSLGAELTHVVSRHDRTEFLWRGDPAIWGRRAPILFPIVGKVTNGMYRYGGKEFSMGQHGFSREEVVFRLSDTPALRRVYPFSFELLVIYRLSGRVIDVTYSVRNPGTATMWFSIGGHPGFSCPLEPDLKFEDYVVEFDRPITASRHLIVDGLIRSEAQPFLSNQSAFALTKELFRDDAIVLKHGDARHAVLRSPKGKKYVRVEFPGWPFLGIWTKPGPFLCIEPWYGIADTVGFDGDLTRKEGIRHLERGEEFECRYSIEIGE